MSKSQDYIKTDKDHYGKIFVDISYAIDNIYPFLDSSILNKRKYAVKFPVIKKYISLLDSAELEAKKNTGFKSLFKNDNSTSLLDSYKRDNNESLVQLENCSKCACLNCTAQCNFASCAGCKSKSYIKKCDHEQYNITFHENFTLELTNNSSGNTNRYKVLATMEDCLNDKKYIAIENIMNSQDKFILHYYSNISGDDFGEITDGEEFDAIASLYESSNY